MARKMTEAQLNNLKGHEFKPGQSGNPKGRPKNRISKLLQNILPKSRRAALREDLNMSEIDTIERKVLQLEVSDLQLIAKTDEGIPAYLNTLARAIIIDMKNGKTTTVDKLRDRQYGPAKQDLEIKASVDFTELLVETGAIDDYENDGEDSEEQGAVDTL